MTRNIIICLSEEISPEGVQSLADSLVSKGVKPTKVLGRIQTICAVTELTNEQVQELSSDIVSVSTEKTIQI